MARIKYELNNPPDNDKWFSITLLRTVNILAPFDADLGEDRSPILRAICNERFSQEQCRKNKMF